MCTDSDCRWPRLSLSSFMFKADPHPPACARAGMRLCVTISVTTTTPLICHRLLMIYWEMHLVWRLTVIDCWHAETQYIFDITFMNIININIFIFLFTFIMTILVHSLSKKIFNSLYVFQKHSNGSANTHELVNEYAHHYHHKLFCGVVGPGHHHCLMHFHSRLQLSFLHMAPRI